MVRKEFVADEVAKIMSDIDRVRNVAIIAHVQQTPGKIAQAPGLTINGSPTDAITLTPTKPASDARRPSRAVRVARSGSTTSAPVTGSSTCTVGGVP